MESLSQNNSQGPGAFEAKDADETLMDEGHFQALLKTAETLQGMIAALAAEGKNDAALEGQLKDHLQLIAYQRSLRPEENPTTLN